MRSIRISDKYIFTDNTQEQNWIMEKEREIKHQT